MFMNVERIGLERVASAGMVFYQVNAWARAGVRHGIFTRHGGVSAGAFDSLNMGGNVGDAPEHVRENHRRMYAAAGVNAARACSVWQVHSAEIVLARRPAHGRRWICAADGLITDEVDTPLTMRFADCVPILLLDRSRGVVGIVHAGWRGTAAGVAGAAVRAMVEAFGVKAASVEAVIGPSIGPARYQVGEEVVQAIAQQYRESEGLVRRDPADGSAWLNLWAANQRDLERAGVGHVETAGLCTASRTDEFYSHRAEHGRTGRFGAVISL